MKYLPFTTKSGLRIGSEYQHAVLPHHDRDALTLQDALLSSKRRLGFFQRIVNALYRWL